MAIRSGNAPLNVEALTAAGTTKADAAVVPVNSSPALVTATGDGTAGILLPPAAAGKSFHVKNLGAGTLKVYPTGSDQINAIAVGDPIVMAAYTSAVFDAADSVHWYTLPLLPS